jgi:hypothetical protein
MRVIRSAGQNVSPSDDGRLYNEAFLDGLFEETTIASLGSNVVSIDTLYGIMCGRDFTAEAQTINVELPEDTDTNGYIYVEFDTTTDDVISIGSALAPFTPVYTDINTTGTVCQMVIAEYTASAVAVTSITPVYNIATTKPNNSLVGSMAQVETSPATAAHAVGSYIVWNNQLYEVTSAISVGETLVVGSNISATDMGSEISDLKSDLNGKLNNTCTHRSIGNGRNGIPWQAGMKEATVCIRFGLNSNYFVEFHIVREMFDLVGSGELNILNGGYKSSDDNHFIVIAYSKTGVTLKHWYYNGTDISASNACEMHVFERF